MGDIAICAEHDLNELEALNVGGGVVMLACTKCPWWEPAPPSDVEITVTYGDPLP